MKIADIIKIENNSNIFLHNEGLFCLPCEILFISLGGVLMTSAYAFIKNVKQYNTKKKFINLMKEI